MYKGLLELIKLIFGPKAISKTIGTRTNVIRLPNNKIKRYTKSDLDIESASDAAAMNAKKEMEELIAEIPKMNDAERLIFEGNLRRLKNRLGIRSETDSTADVFQFGTKEKVTPGGIASLTEKAGQKSPPGTLMGNIESRIKQLEASGQDPSTMKGQTLDEIMGDVASSQQGMRQLEKQGLVRATARDIITSDIKSGKLKLPKELEQQILEGGGEPIDVLRNVYGEDALEVLDSLIPEFSKLRTSTEAEKLARSKFKFEPDVNRPKGSMSLDEAKKAEQENILTPKKPEEPEEFATGGRVGFNEGSKLTDYIKTNISASTSSSSPEEGVKVKQEILDGIISLNIPLNKKLKLLGDLKFGKNRAKVDLSELGKKYGIDLGEEVYKDTYLSPGLGAEYTTDEGTKFNFMVNPEDKQGSISFSRSFATGGRVGYSDGTKPSAEENTPSQEIINRMMAQIKQMSKMGADIDTIKTITGASDQMIKDVLGKASGGSMSTGLDYLMGIDRKNYQQGSAPVDELIINLINSGDSTQSPSTTTSTPSTFQPTVMDMVGLIANPVLGAANITSRRATGLSLVERAMDAMGIGRGPGGRTQGYGVDSANAMSVADQGVAVGDMGGYGGNNSSSSSGGMTDAAGNDTSPGATGGAGGESGSGSGDASAAGANDGPGTGGSFAQGGIVNRTGFKFGTKFGRFWKIARKVWDDINPTGDRKYDAQLVADELAEQIFKTSMDDLPQNAQIDLYALAYNNAPKVDALFKNPQSLSEAAKKGMAASKEMESLGLDVSKNSDFFKYEEMKLSGQLGPEHQVQAYKDKIRDEFYGVIDDTLMKQVEVDDNPQRLAEVYASIKEGLTMQKKRNDTRRNYTSYETNSSNEKFTRWLKLFNGAIIWN
jgi:hypothetical protein